MSKPLFYRRLADLANLRSSPLIHTDDTDQQSSSRRDGPCGTAALGGVSPYILKNMAVANPKSVKVNVTTGTGMDIEWTDGHQSHYVFQWLRDACPCATCEEARKEDHRPRGVPAIQPATVFPLYKEPVRPKEVTAVGRYALNFKWNDGHETGIYSWDYLREMCQCEECKKIG